jgi:hypothetical protein
MKLFSLFFGLTALVGAQSLNGVANQSLGSLLSPGSAGVVVSTGTSNTTTAVGTATVPLTAQNIESVFYADQFASVQAAITAAGQNGTVVIPATYNRTDSWTNPNHIQVLDYRPASQSVYNVKSWGCKGDGVTDDTACLTSFFAFINTKALATAYFPTGKYLMNGTLRCTSYIAFRGDGANTTFLVETNPTADLLILMPRTIFSVASFDYGPSLTDLSLAGHGTATTGNLLVNETSDRTVIEHVSFLSHGGVALLHSSERLMMHDVHWYAVRQAWVTSRNYSMNETYLDDFTMQDVGCASDSVIGGTTGLYFYNVNATNGVFPASGTLIQDQHAAVELNANTVNVRIANGSIKSTHCIAGVKLRSGENLELAHLYFEGFVNGAVNPSLIFGGPHEKTLLSNAITTSQVTFDIANGMWFQPSVSNASDLQYMFSGSYTNILVRPPDFVAGSTAASSLGNGIQKGSFEYMSFKGIVHDATGSGWHVQIAARAQGGTTAYAWPAGSIFEDTYGDAVSGNESPYAYPVHLIDNHFNSVNTYNGYTINCDPNNEKTCGEIILGFEPDAFYVFGGPHAISNAQRVLHFDGNNTVRASSDMGKVIDTYGWTMVDLTGTSGIFTSPSISSNINSISLPALGGGVVATRESFASTGFGGELDYADKNASFKLIGHVQGFSVQPEAGSLNTALLTYYPSFSIGDQLNNSTVPANLWSFSGSSGLTYNVWNGSAYNSIFSVDGSGNAAATTVIATRSTPASSSESCRLGAIWGDDNYIYRCTSTGIKRIALTAF